MAKGSAIVVGSGAGGSVAAWVLRTAGYDVLILEKGRNLLPGLGTKAGVGSLFSNDEVKENRYFENPDPLLEPRTSRSQSDAQQGVQRSFVGDVNGLPTVVGGGTVHWDAKTPRFWKQDFKGLSQLGPIDGANIADWPLTYDDLAPYYDEVEARIGVQGDVNQMPATTLAQAPRSKPFPLPPNPPMASSLRLQQGAAALGYHVYPYPMAVHSQAHHIGGACNSCGFCTGFGCPVNARGGALSWLHDALLAGAELRPRSFVHRVDLSPDKRRAVGVTYRDASGNDHQVRADVVILAASAIETARLGLMSNLPDQSGQLGRNLMFHFFTLGVGLFSDTIHAWRGPASTHTCDDFVGPDKGPEITAAGLPYIKGGICEVGGTFGLLAEAEIYAVIPNFWGQTMKDQMKTGFIRDHIAGMSFIGEDLPQLNNRVDLDPSIKDVYGFPVPRITRSAHKHELFASEFYGPKLMAIQKAAPNNLAAIYLPIATIGELGGPGASFAAGPAATAHIMGTARMGADPKTSVVDPFGRMHGLDNMFVADGSPFVSSGGFNPTLTIMALALRMSRHLVGEPARPATPAARSAPASTGRLPATGGDGRTAALGAAAAAAGLGLGRLRRPQEERVEE